MNGEGAGVIDTPPTCTVVPAHMNVGSYPITCSGGLADTYQFSFTGGTPTVTKAGQTVSFDGSAPAGALVGGTGVETATATSGLAAAVTVDASTTNSACSLTGSTVHFDAVGTCVLAANQAGDADWNAAPQVLRSFSIGPTQQTITSCWTPSATR